MDSIKYKFTLDVTKPGAQKCLTGFSVGESKARQCIISLTNGKNPIHFTGLESVSIFVRRPSDTTPSVSGCTIEGDNIIYNVLQNDVDEAGVTEFTIKIIQMDGLEPAITFAAKFMAQVEDPDCDDSHVPSDPHYSVLEQLIIDVEELKTEVTGYDQDAEAWAKGTRGGVPVTSEDPAYNNNSKYYCENVQLLVEEQVQEAEAWAVGKRGGQDVPDTDPAYHNNSKYYKEQAATSASNASASETNALGYKNAASSSASNANTDALKAEGYAVGKQNGTEVVSGEYFHNNAKYYKEQAATSATNAATSETNAGTSETNALGYKNAASSSASSANTDALKAEGYAVGKQNGTDVTNESPYYHANAKYYKEQAAASESNASGSATAAAASKTDAEAWAVGKRNGTPVTSDDPTYNNNAEYWATQSHASQVQSDWNQSDNTQVDYIKNKPDLSLLQTKQLIVPITIGGTLQSTVEGALGGLNTTEQPKTLATPITVGGTSQTTVESALGAINTDKQSKTLSSSITVAGTSQTTVEGALGAINTMAAGKATTATYTATIPTISGSSATVAVNGILAGDNPIVDINFSGSESSSTISDTIAAWSKVWRITTQANQITVYVTEATTVTIPIQLKVVR